MDQRAFEPFGNLTNPAQIGCRQRLPAGPRSRAVLGYAVFDIRSLLYHFCVFMLDVCVSVGYTLVAMKDAGLRIRVQRDLREQFLEVCRAQDKPAAQVLREFMRQYIEANEDPKPNEQTRRART